MLDHIAYILIAIGGFIFLVSFLGYCGSLQESRVMLTAYGFFLIIIFALQIAGIVLCVAYSHKADHQVRATLRRSLTESYTIKQTRDPVSLIWDLVMSRMECCGVNDYTDFQDARKFQAEVVAEGLGRKIPDSCCANNNNNNTVTDDWTEEFSVSPASISGNNCISLPTTTNSYIYEVKTGLDTICFTKQTF